MEPVLGHYPQVQGVYLFGSYGTKYARPNSDVDVALMLPVEEAEEAGQLSLIPCAMALSRLLERGVDLFNLREVTTVFQKEIIAAERLCVDPAIRHVVGGRAKWRNATSRSRIARFETHGRSSGDSPGYPGQRAMRWRQRRQK